MLCPLSYSGNCVSQNLHPCMFSGQRNICETWKTGGKQQPLFSEGHHCMQWWEATKCLIGSSICSTSFAPLPALLSNYWPCWPIVAPVPPPKAWFLIHSSKGYTKETGTILKVPFTTPCQQLNVPDLSDQLVGDSSGPHLPSSCGRSLSSNVSLML